MCNADVIGRGMVFLDHYNSPICSLHKHRFVLLKTSTSMVVNHVESSEELGVQKLMDKD